ncbi:hypothetical protein HOK51_08690 [Candidatus Woesearchaeota archaeon]|nr:hypothetical protein [Candidatus Woesearchaeota archaeon]MBT6519904.1 hypothetical protein [Candidatus Woesearchaeota archaeon]MBT7367120.1 hypothetical protein [Candidatus Woesearchaeota archaeon]
MKYRKAYVPIDPNKPIMRGIKTPSELEKKVIRDKRVNGIFRKLTDWYYKPKSFERSGKMYTRLGVRYFQKGLMNSYGGLLRFLGGKKGPGNYFIGNKRTVSDMVTYEGWTRFNELIHMPLMFTCGYDMLENLSQGNYGAAAGEGALVLLNSYCVFLQRYNRARVYNTLDLKLK